MKSVEVAIAGKLLTQRARVNRDTDHASFLLKFFSSVVESRDSRGVQGSVEALDTQERGATTFATKTRFFRAFAKCANSSGGVLSN